jgi:hypothetical protein
MRLTGRKRILAAAALLLFGAVGCQTVPKEPPVRLTGDIMVDGPNAIAHGPARDKVLWQYRTALGAMRHADYALARQLLDDAILSIGGIITNDKNARQARSYFHGEAKKTFIGEPYERCMAYVYRGIIYWMDGDPDNARACFRNAEFIDSDAEKHEYAGDWILPDYLEGLITQKLGGDGADACKRAQAEAKGIKLPPYNTKANVVFFFEFSPGPTKYAAGEYGQELHFGTPASPVVSAELKLGSRSYPVAPTDDVSFQATTRGGRVMDHILGNKAVFKTTTDVVGNVALVGGLGTAILSRDQTAQEVGLGVALAGVLSKVVSAATVAEADTRTWDNLPRYLSFASLSLPPGQHVATIEFRDAAGNTITNLTKTITINVPSDGKDKVVFISDQSSTPQTI